MAEQKEWQQREGTFSLRKNPNKKQEKAPDVIGTLMLNGVAYELSGWNKTAASGAMWMSGTIKPPFASKPATEETIPF
jgi:hypothetical protein